MQNDVARFYTKARRIPILIGKLPDGTALPFGPYTLGQVISTGAVALLLLKTTAVWARLGVIGDIALFIGILAATAFTTGKIPSIGRNPLAWAYDALSLVFAAFGEPSGSKSGRQLTVGRPRRVTHRIITTPTRPTPALEVEPTPSLPAEIASDEPHTPPIDETSAPVDRAPAEPASIELTGVGRLLAGALAGKDPHA